MAARQRVSGLMLANHTAVRHVLDRTVDQFSRPFEKKARSLLPSDKRGWSEWAGACNLLHIGSILASR